MAILTYSELNNLCKRPAGLPHTWNYSPTDVREILDSELIDLFLNLYNTGLRFQELWQYERWTDLEDGTYEVDTLKGSDNRIISAADLSESYKNKLADSIQPYQTCKYSTANFWLKRALHPFSLGVDSSTITTHIFRHRFFKMLDEGAESLEAIKIITGEVDTGNALGYINSDIYS